MNLASTPGMSRLVEGYRRFHEGAWPPNRERWQKLRAGQDPDVMVIACSDSRVDPSQIFDFDPGEVFVVRNVAALVPPFETTPGHHGVSAALEFAVQFLGVKEIVVLGHGMCGGCRASLTREMRTPTTPRSVNLKAFDKRFLMTCCRRLMSVYITGGRLLSSANAKRSLRDSATWVKVRST